MAMEEEIVSDDKYCQSQTAVRRKATSQEQQLMEHGNYEEAIQVVNHFLSFSSNPLQELTQG
ncbi:hypothetical protein AMTRI_Chr10g1550 [Amborella trichopoda]